MRLRPFRFAALFGSLLAVAVPIVSSQGRNTPFGWDEASTRETLLRNLQNPQPLKDDSYVSAAWKKMPPAGRAQLATQAYAWARAYVGSAEFKKAYAEAREAYRPPTATHEGTVDQEVKAKMAQTRAEGEASYKEMLSAGMKAEAEAFKTQLDASLVMMEPMLRIEVQEARARDAAENKTALPIWERDFPQDPLVLIARHLREYLANSTGVDFAARQVQQRNGVGELEWVFVEAAYNQKPWQWKASYDFGAEGTAAARAAAEAWLKELGPK